MDRGHWIDPRGRDDARSPSGPRSSCRSSPSLAPTTQADLSPRPRPVHPPAVRRVRLGRLSPEEIENWLNDELAKGFAPSSVHRHYRTLRRMLQIGGREGPVAHQPVRPGPSAEGPEDGDDGAHVGAGDGAGRGPLRALPHADLRRRRHRHALERARRAAAGRSTSAAGRSASPSSSSSSTTARGSAGQPKTAAGMRSITISPVAAMLADHLDRFAAPGSTRLVFPNGAGQPLVVELPEPPLHAGPAPRRRPCRFHDLRHTSVALAIAEGAHPKAIQVRMGHSSINVTLDRYGHLFPELDEAIARSFGERNRRSVPRWRQWSSTDSALARPA